MSQTTLPDDLAPAIAKWLAPHIAAELDAIGYPSSAAPTYDQRGCALLCSELGINSLNRAGDFFARLERDGAVGSREMAVHLSLGTPRNISSALTTPVKRISRRLGFTELPWDEDVDSEDRTVWRDRDGIAGRMKDAIDAERTRRHQSGG